MSHTTPKHAKFGYLTPVQLYEIALGLNYLHNQGIIHADVKAVRVVLLV